MKQCLGERLSLAPSYLAYDLPGYRATSNWCVTLDNSIITAVTTRMPTHPNRTEHQEQRCAIQEAFGHRLRAERLRRGIGQKVLASGLRISRTTVSNLERGVQRPYLDQVYAAAQILGITAAELLPAEADLLMAPTISATEPLSSVERVALERAVANVREELSITATSGGPHRHRSAG